MSTAIGTIGRGGRNRSLIAGMMAMVAASFDNVNAVEIKANPDTGAPWDKPMVKLPGMSPRDFARYRSRCGHPRKSKNLHHCARLAKVKRRRASRL